MFNEFFAGHWNLQQHRQDKRPATTEGFTLLSVEELKRLPQTFRSHATWEYETVAILQSKCSSDAMTQQLKSVIQKSLCWLREGKKNRDKSHVVWGKRTALFFFFLKETIEIWLNCKWIQFTHLYFKKTLSLANCCDWK